MKQITVDPSTSQSLQNLTTHSPVSHDLSLIGLFMQAGLTVKFVMLFLLACSIYSWGIILDKLVAFKSVLGHINSFKKAFYSGQSLDSLYQKINGQQNHPIAALFCAAMMQFQYVNKSDFKAHAIFNENANNAMQLSINKTAQKLQNKLSTLATISSVTPFVGLFGTVWGIMASFQSIAMSQNTSLAVVAPGIAEALLATAIGLLAAIPAAIFYNKLSSDFNRIIALLEDFAMELSLVISKELEK